MNPLYSGILTGFKIEILDGTSSRILEKIYFNGNVLITPGILAVSVDRPNDYKLANTTYKF